MGENDETCARAATSAQVADLEHSKAYPSDDEGGFWVGCDMGAPGWHPYSIRG